MRLHPSLPCTALALLALLTAAASHGGTDPDVLLREGDAAFAGGNYARAVELYEQAEVRATDPERVAFHLASARYRLAEAEDSPSSPALREAEQLYRCCLGPTSPWRARALLGLGNCLLRKAAGRDADSLRAALRCYEECVQASGGDEGLAADARYNRERARLLLLQFQPPRGSRKKPEGEDSGPNPRPPDRQPNAKASPVGEPGAESGADPNGAAVPVKPDPGQAPAPSDQPPPPGPGNLPPVPDQAEPAPLSATAAAAHLEQATRRIVDEGRTHRRERARPPSAGVRDW
jgi:hypothetical protein